MNMTKILKYSLITTFGIVILGGIIMLIVGSVVQSQINKTRLPVAIGGYAIPAGSIISIIIGILTIFLGSVGIYGAVKDKFRFLYLYSGVMIFIFIIQIITGAVALSVRNNPKFEMYAFGVFASDLSFNSTSPEKRDFYQQYFKCCGWNGINDYVFDNRLFNLPVSCCKVVENCNVNDLNQLFNNPCKNEILPLISQFIQVIGIILIVFGCINFVSIIFSAIYGKKIRME